jgi:polar amino acid transport system substrate-binding protein
MKPGGPHLRWTGWAGWIGPFGLAVLGAALLLSAPGVAQPREAVVIPFHGDPRVRVDRPEGPVPRNLRVITDDEFPPLHFADADGQPVGFSVELMRAVCERMAVNCTVQARRFDTLLQTLADGQADIVAAAIPVTAQLKSRFHVSRVYHRLPARFAAVRGLDAAALERGLEGLRVAVVRETAHAAYLAEHLPKAQAVETPDLSSALSQLRRAEVDLVFGDAQSIALWLGLPENRGFAFSGGPRLSIRHFGEGIGFVLRPDEPNLKRAVDFALQSLWDDGTYGRLYLKYFPVGLF